MRDNDEIQYVLIENIYGTNEEKSRWNSLVKDDNGLIKDHPPCRNVSRAIINNYYSPLW